MSAVEAFGDVATFLAKLGPEKILELKANKEMAERVETLTQKKKDETLSAEELVELERYLSLDLLINLAKARAVSVLRKLAGLSRIVVFPQRKASSSKKFFI